MKKPFLYRVPFKIVTLLPSFWPSSLLQCPVGVIHPEGRTRLGSSSCFHSGLWRCGLLRCWNISGLQSLGLYLSILLLTMTVSPTRLLGIYVNSTWLNSCVKSFINFRYFCILSSFASNSPFIWPITSFESLWRSKYFTPNAFLTLNPVSTPSYSTSLFVARNTS